MHFDEFLKRACPEQDLDWRKYRRASRRRVLERIAALGLTGYADYLDYLQSHPREAGELPNLLRVTVTRFFRDRACWQELAEDILPRLITRNATRTLQALSLGSCGGEEPYSLALVWAEYLQPRFPEHSLNITGLEMDPAGLARARQAVYQPGTLREVPEEIKARWFSRDKNTFRLDQSIKERVSFRQLDLLKEPLPANQDLILCRYLFFTYFKGSRLLGVSRRIRQALNESGLLMIGLKEDLGSEAKTLFEPVFESGCFYAS